MNFFTAISEVGIETTKLEEFTDKLLNGFIDILPELIFAIIIYIVGTLISKLVLKIMARGANRGNIDKTAYSFLRSLVSIVLKVFILVIVLTVLGVPMTSIIAVIGAAGLAIGLALQDSLSNLAGGFIILLSKPFGVGDFVETNDVSGTVEAISILYTKLVTADGRGAFIPNGLVANSKLVNCMDKDYRRLDLSFSVAYESDIDAAKSAIAEVVEKNPMASKSPAPVIRTARYAASSVDIDVLVWTRPSDYLALKYDLNESVRAALDSNGICIPFSQLEVRLKPEHSA